MSAASNSDETLTPLYLKENGVVALLRRHGRLRPLKTCLETQALNQTVEAHVVEIPTRAANNILRALDGAIPEKDAINLQHLRRFAKPGFLPDQLRVLLSSTTTNIKNEEVEENNPKSLTQDRHADTPSSDRETTPEPSLHLLVCAASTIPSSDLASILSTLGPFSESQITPPIRALPVPLLPPTSDEQAARWSRQYWPTVYQRNNPFGPQPSLISRAEAEIKPQMHEYMALARRAGREVQEMGLGEAIGVVIVDRKAGVKPVDLAVAGDGRWTDSAGDKEGERRKGSGNVMAHAVMRAIGMIARKRREVAETLARQANEPDVLKHIIQVLPHDDVFADRPLGDLEKYYYAQSPIAPHGYLCLDLEIYISHEPCVMCSMAINHSRFGKVVFGKRMSRSGGLTSELTDATGSSPATGVEKVDTSESCSEPGLGYGLFWRPGLNWKLLAWEWVVEDGDEDDEVGEDVHV